MSIQSHLKTAETELRQLRNEAAIKDEIIQRFLSDWVPLVHHEEWVHDLFAAEPMSADCRKMLEQMSEEKS